MNSLYLLNFDWQQPWQSGVEVITTKPYKRQNKFEMSCSPDEFLVIISYDQVNSLATTP